MTAAADFLPHIQSIAHGAGNVLLSYFRQLSGYDHKGVVDLVTQADRDSEDYIAREILKRFPDHAILGEEGGKRGNPDGEYLWIVDPLDGTTNFVHGMRLFCISIALLHRGVPIAAAVYAPALDEYFAAAKGHGTTRNGSPVRVSTAARLIDALLVTGFPAKRHELLDVITGMVYTSLRDARGLLRLGAAALDLAYVAAGNLDAFYEYGIHPWDMAAGWLLVEEAGGKVTGFLPGEPFDVYRNRIVASNGLIHDDLQRILVEGGAEKIPK